MKYDSHLMDQSNKSIESVSVRSWGISENPWYFCISTLATPPQSETEVGIRCPRFNQKKRSKEISDVISAPEHALGSWNPKSTYQSSLQRRPRPFLTSEKVGRSIQSQESLPQITNFSYKPLTNKQSILKGFPCKERRLLTSNGPPDLLRCQKWSRSSL